MDRARSSLALALAALVCALAPGAAAADAVEPASVRMVSCAPWHAGTPGNATYEARMHTMPGAARMAMRFQLQERGPNGRFRRVRAPGQRAWHTSRRGAVELRWVHKFEGLRQGGAYRVRVRYRWLGADGAEVRSAVRRSKQCRAPGGLSNLHVSDVQVSQGLFDGIERYRVTVVNRGEAAAHDVGLLLRVDGEVVDEADPIATLAPGESRSVGFSGPPCRRSLSGVVDPSDAIAESREDDNVRAVSCV